MRTVVGRNVAKCGMKEKADCGMRGRLWKAEVMFDEVCAMNGLWMVGY